MQIDYEWLKTAVNPNPQDVWHARERNRDSMSRRAIHESSALFKFPAGRQIKRILERARSSVGNVC